MYRFSLSADKQRRAVEKKQLSDRALRLRAFEESVRKARTSGGGVSVLVRGQDSHVSEVSATPALTNVSLNSQQQQHAAQTERLLAAFLAPRSPSPSCQNITVQSSNSANHATTDIPTTSLSIDPTTVVCSIADVNVPPVEVPHTLNAPEKVVSLVEVPHTLNATETVSIAVPSIAHHSPEASSFQASGELQEMEARLAELMLLSKQVPSSSFVMAPVSAGMH